MSYIEIEHNQLTGWFCNNDLILISDREIFENETNNPFIDDNKLLSICSSNLSGTRRRRRRYIPQLDFNDKKFFSSKINKSPNEINIDEELVSELNSMLACREYVSKQNHFFDRKQFRQAQAVQANEEKKFEEYKKRQQEQSKIERQQRRRQHPSYVSRFDEKRYVPSIRKKSHRFND